MKILKSILAGIFWLLILALMVAPLGMIYQISNDELQEYETPEVPKLVETSMGEAVRAKVQDVAEYTKVSGTFTSTAYAYQELDYKNPGTIRWMVGTGDEVQEGQVIGTYSGQEILAAQTGILIEMNTYTTDAYLRYRLFAPLELECRVTEEELAVLLSAENLLTESGEPVAVSYASRQKNADGTTNVRLCVTSEAYSYGQTVELNLLTGKVYYEVIVLPVECVYQKFPGEEEPWYVRQVTAKGHLIGEREVEIGYSNGDVVIVTGVEVNTYYDSGYKAVMGG